jgi:hypothetical protein
MGIGLFTDKSNQPTDAQVRAAVGAKLPLWQELIRAIRERYSVQEDFKFLYGKKYGWALRFRVKSQLLVSLFPTQGGFITQVNLNPDAIEKALALGMSKNVQQAIARAHPYPEGRWLFIPIDTEEDLSDVQQLVEMRAYTKRLLKQ